MGRDGVRKLLKQQKNREILIPVTDTRTRLGRNDIIYCQLLFLPINFGNLISDSGRGKQNQVPFLLSPPVKVPFFSEAVSDVEGLQSGHRSFSLQLLLALAVLPV